ncbi:MULTISPECIES: precorrin-4 C(11)-methyltransferase [unclassified Butyrivibrio]|uniref:precorrin-4 C(11)-methyltransferase n=1 Tax=unclassified Butyrivibrio TaxID=2639466 RepID=UPI000410EA5C|nr:MULTISPECIES: precorrin-4 C(11)-methyltransferase [unclassified Butyrivibrio]
MVNFVGAGPGAVDLITVRGMELLKKADVVIYAGSLVNPEILTYTRKEAKIYNSAVMTLEEVMAVMINAHKEGKEVVRLHTGEPSIYGAVREQMDELDKEKIPYASCPGVSACFGAAAALNIEYTLPDVSQTLIITRLEGKTKVPEKEQMELLSQHGASMAIYLSAGMLKELSDRLISGGYSKDTPCAIVYKATWPEEKKIICTLENLAEKASEENITKTAIVLVGDAISHSSYDRSKLYDPEFSTEFRKRKSGITNEEDSCMLYETRRGYFRKNK